MTSEAQATKEKMDTLSFVRIKTSVSKDTIERVKRKLTEWEKMFCKSYILKD